MTNSNQQAIPSVVVKYQNSYGYNHSEYIATIDDEDVYALSLLDDNGFPLPVGLPSFLCVRSGKCRRVTGEDALKLQNVLFDNE